MKRQFGVGAELSEDGVDFRVWAPDRKLVQVVIGGSGGAHPMQRDADGYHSAMVKGAGAGTRYSYRLESEGHYPDPASRFQPEGIHLPSEVIDGNNFPWKDSAWKGCDPRGQVVYEMHVGTFTAAGTWESAIAELPYLADTGITVLEIMPVAEFPGKFGWGYDGVHFFAPTRLYGRPDDFRRFVDAAHALRMGVILDVVYNHIGPDGNYLTKFNENYLSKIHKTDWGAGMNFDGVQREGVRQYCLDNARYWIEEFHLDGLRLDATQDIYDDTECHILREIARVARAAAGERKIILIGENEQQNAKLVRPEQRGGYGLDALWNDDFHHSAMARLTGRNEAYYTDYLGNPQEFVSAAKYGFLYQGQQYKWQKNRRGSAALDLMPHNTVNFIQNHDQVANSAYGLRVHALTDPGNYRAMSALLLLAPNTPMIFQGQEFAASTPFFYFADHQEPLGKMVCEGRIEFLAQFRTFKTREFVAKSADPCDSESFQRSKLDHGERKNPRHADLLRLYRELLKLRREDIVLSAPLRTDGAVLSGDAFLLRYFGAAGDRLLIVNFGLDLHLNPSPEPLLGPMQDMAWEILWSSEDVRYGGIGTAEVETPDNWKIPGHAAVVMKPCIRREPIDSSSAADKD